MFASWSIRPFLNLYLDYLSRRFRIMIRKCTRVELFDLFSRNTSSYCSIGNIERYILSYRISSYLLQSIRFHIELPVCISFWLRTFRFSAMPFVSSWSSSAPNNNERSSSCPFHYLHFLERRTRSSREMPWHATHFFLLSLDDSNWLVNQRSQILTPRLRRRRLMRKHVVISSTATVDSGARCGSPL